MSVPAVHCDASMHAVPVRQWEWHCRLPDEVWASTVKTGSKSRHGAGEVFVEMLGKGRMSRFWVRLNGRNHRSGRSLGVATR
jgi:hypothetical protein